MAYSSISFVPKFSGVHPTGITMMATIPFPFPCRSSRLPRLLSSHFLHFHSFSPKSPSPSPESPKPINPNSPSNYKNRDPSLNHTTVLETLACYSNDWKRAMDFFNWVETERGFQHTTETYNLIIDILGKFFEYEFARQLLDKMIKSNYASPDHATFRVMFKRYVAAHLVKEAIDLFNEMTRFNLKDDLSFSNLIDVLCEHKHVIEAEELCLRMNSENTDSTEKLGFKLTTKIYNMILRGWSKMKWWGKCREFWEKMDRMGVCKDLHSYSIYMDIQCKSGKPWKAVRLYKEMKKKGIELDVVAYNTVIHAIGVSDGVDVAVRLGREMMELGCEPNVVTYNTIVKLLCENGRMREANKVLGKMFARGCAPDVITYHCIFACLEKPREILRLFDKMVASGVHPRMDTYVLLLRKFGRWGFLRPVFDIWKKMEELGLSPNESAYNALIDALLEKGMIDMARKYDVEMLAKGLSGKPRVELDMQLEQGEFNRR